MTHSTEQPDEHTAGDSALEQRSRELFNAQVDGLGARTRSRLNRARQAALAAASGASSGVSVGQRWLLPVGSAAALALVTVSAVQLMRAAPETVPASASLAASNTVDDMEILASNEELDMLQNVDFYAWLDTQADGLATGSSASETG